MAALPPIELSAKEQLRILRRLDPVHPWQTLSETRPCPACQRATAGREIEIIGGTRGYGPLRLQCPSCGENRLAKSWSPQNETPSAPADNCPEVTVSRNGAVYHCRRKTRRKAAKGFVVSPSSSAGLWRSSLGQLLRKLGFIPQYRRRRRRRLSFHPIA